jgi:hypothetical protein
VAGFLLECLAGFIGIRTMRLRASETAPAARATALLRVRAEHDLCSAGAASFVRSAGPWTWSCAE